MTDELKSYQEEQKRYEEAWSFLIPRFLPGWKWQQQLSAGTGWCELVKMLVAELDSVWEGWNGMKGSECWGLMQCKEKFGGLRFYTGSALPESKDNPDFEAKWKSFREVISKYENKSITVCETCGKSGERRSLGGWILTCCQEDYDERLKDRVESEKRTHKEHAQPEEELMDDIERKRRGLPARWVKEEE